MCGIWALFGLSSADCHLADFGKIRHRGPDAWRVEYDQRLKNGCVGFHRLTIVDSLYSMQPLKIRKYPNYSVICNGELYNHKTLMNEHGFVYETNGDIECILHLYAKFGMEETLKRLDGVYAFCLVDTNANRIHLARDPYGVRPLFRFYSHDHKVLALCSEAKGIVNVATSLNEIKQLEQMPSGTMETYAFNDEGYVSLISKNVHFKTEEDVKFWKLVPHTRDIQGVYDGIATLFTEACRKRMMSERRIGCFLSGGLDSSLVASIIVKLAKETNLPYKIQTFSVGMESSPDLVAAREVANHIGSEHYELIFDEKAVSECIDDVIYQAETYDTTTVRSSIGLYLLCKYIKSKTDTTVIFSGEGADELAQGYIYFRDAPDAKAAYEESLRLLSDIYLYDGIRTDRITSAFSLEVRCPFLDIDFTRFYLSQDKELLRPSGDIEKHLIRKAFSGTGLLPDHILWRPKEAFSDGLAAKSRSLFQVVQDIIDDRMCTDEFMANFKKYPHCTPKSKESFYYRKSFEKSYRGFDHLIPYFWMPKWNGDVTDPSARYIKHYNAEKTHSTS